MLAGKLAFIPRSLVVYRTEISTSNQATVSSHPAAIFDALLSLKTFFRKHALYKQYRDDLNDLAIHHILAILLINTPSGQRDMLNCSPAFLKDFGITDAYVRTLSENKRAILKAMIVNDHDAYLLAERKELVDAQEVLVARIPPLEERIRLELRELNHYRDNPSIRTAVELLKKAIRAKLNKKT